ncbi:MAG: hypothetical protein LQ339_001082 [Xanthoria mediterranea]|nr:MAG: hypothetical protein LQ339_001082 [Xanthoria mediterranea]
MATLAEISSAPGQCVHKLPTSCQLTAQLTCCACGDKRPQASSFSRYIDGVGFVLGGKRQERYCPNCQQFWDARIEVSGIPQSSTRIPTLPDQTTFVQQWFDWHRGYSIITNPDGTEHRHVLTEEIQAGVEPALNVQSRDPQQIIRDETHSLLNSEDIDPEDRIFDTWSTSESAFDSDPEDSQDNTTAAQHLLRVLRQNLEDLRANVIELTQRIPRHRASSQVSTISSELNSITRSLGSMRQQHNPNTHQLAAAQVMDRPNLQEEGDDELLQRVGQLFYQRRQLLNTPESPQRNSQLAFLGGDIDRVLVVCDSRGRTQQAQDSSLHEPEQNPSEPRVSRNNVQPRAGYRSSFLHGPNGPPTPLTSDFDYFRSLRFPPFFSPSDSSDSPHSETLSGGPGSSEIWPQLGQGPGGWNSNMTAGDGSRLQRWTQRPVPSLDDSTRLFSDMISDTPRMADLLPNLVQARRAGRQGIPTEEARSPRQRQPGPKPSLDNDPTRPAAVAEEAKNINMECKVCLQQISNQVLLPCGHCCMCHWCSIQAFPRQNGDSTRPKDRKKPCIICRRIVKQIVVIYP